VGLWGVCILSIGLVSCLDVLNLQQKIFQAQWKMFKNDHTKNYDSSEDHRRFRTFLQNSNSIAIHNERFERGLETYELGPNQYMDMTHDEFLISMTGTSSESPSQDQDVHVTESSFEGLHETILPESVNWTHQLPPVKNQLRCGSCYAFAAVGSLEGALARKSSDGKVYDLSEQEVVDCSYKSRYGNGGCHGGAIIMSYRYMYLQGGLMEATEYPYKAVRENCTADLSKHHGPMKSVGRVGMNETAVTKALATIGPLAVTLDSNPVTFMLYKRGLYNDPRCGNGSSNHAGVLVGYGSEDGFDYYIYRNSWGASWGEAGYMRLGRDRCSVTANAWYPVLK